VVVWHGVIVSAAEFESKKRSARGPAPAYAWSMRCIMIERHSA
jgi:hypothetical protein